MDPIERMREDLSRLAKELEQLQQARERIEAQARTISGRLAELKNALRIVERYQHTPPSTSAPAKDLLGEPPPIPDRLTNREAIHQALLRNPGKKVRDLVAAAREMYSIEINSKSAGNSLWELKRSGLVRRDGQRWYPIPQDRDTPPEPSSGGVSAHSGPA